MNVNYSDDANSKTTDTNDTAAVAVDVVIGQKKTNHDDKTINGDKDNTVDDDDDDGDDDDDVVAASSNLQQQLQVSVVANKDPVDDIIQMYLPNYAYNSIPLSHIRIGMMNLLQSTMHHDIRILLTTQQVPLYSWSDYNIQYFLSTLSQLDTNQKVPVIISSTQAPMSSPSTGSIPIIPYNSKSSPSSSSSSSSLLHTQRWVGVGEREGKVYSSLTLQRNYGFTHGIGRSGNLQDPQPKAVGSTILSQLTNRLLYDIIVRGGSKINVHGNQTKKKKSSKDGKQLQNSIILPMCTGMSVAMILQSFRQQHMTTVQHPEHFSSPSTAANNSNSKSLSFPPPLPITCSKDIVLWSRIDQKSCYKAIVAAGLHCVVIPTKLNGDNSNNDIDGYGKNDNQTINDDSVTTDIAAINTAIQYYTPQRILAIITTTSCFAPRVPDQVDIVAKLIQQYNTDNIHNPSQYMYHIINHAYGMQCSKTGKLLSRAITIGQVDAIVCSLDKNVLVPVSGSIVLSPNRNVIQQIGKLYPGRASSSHIIDTCIALLSMGLFGYQTLYQQRNLLVPKFINRFTVIAEKYNERILHCPTNSISYAMTLDSLVRQRHEDELVDDYLSSIENDLTQLGAMLFHRCVSGTRVVARNVVQVVNGNAVFVGFGSSYDNYPHAYLTAACAMGLNENEMDEFFIRLDKTLYEFQKKQNRTRSTIPNSEIGNK